MKARSSRFARMNSRTFRSRLLRVPAANPSALMSIAFAVCWVRVEPPWIFLRST